VKNHAHLRALVLIAIGLIGMAGYQVLLHLKHPLFMGSDFVHGLWFGVFLGVELIGLYLLSKNRRRA
jgi:hypothetical protein